MTSVFALIPARSGSKGVPGKNVRELCGYPLLAYSVRAGQKAETIDRVILSTDSSEYAEIGRAYGAETPFLRPSEHAADGSGDEAVVGHLIDWLQEAGEALPDFLVYLRPTTPLRDPAVIDRAVAELMVMDAATSLRSIHEMSESAYKTFELEADWLLPVGERSKTMDAANSPRQNHPTTYVGNGYVDVFKVKRIVQNLPLLGDQVFGFRTGVAAEIDTREDFEYLTYLAGRNSVLVDQLFDNKR